MTGPVVAILLDDGGRVLARCCGTIATCAAALLLVVVTAPVVMLAAAFPSVGPTSSASREPVAGAAPAIIVHPDAVGRAAADTSTTGAVAVARRYLGVPYVFGGTNPAVGLDCSGLVQLVYRELGINLPRTAQGQFNATTRVALDQLEPGDLVFFARTYIDPHDWITHVGIYVGNGMQLNAPTEGQVVSLQPVFSGYWGAHFAAAGRVRRG